jgi:hypothetical protein
VVIAANREGNGLRVQNFVAAADFFARAVNRLVRTGLGWRISLVAQIQNQFAGGIDGNFVRAVEANRNDAGVRVRRDGEIIFKLPLVAVINQIDAGIKPADALWQTSARQSAIAPDCRRSGN